MGFMDNIKNFMNVNDGFDEDEEYDYEDEYVEEEDTYSSTRAFEPKETTSQPKGKFLNIHANSKLSVVLVKPESYAEARQIADHLTHKRRDVLQIE